MRTQGLVDPGALRAARVRAGMTQHQLARIVDVAGGERISLWERGTRSPRDVLVPRLAAALGVSPYDLLDTTPERATLAAHRAAAGLSAPHAAAHASLSLNTYLRLERGIGVRAPDLAVVSAIATALGRSPREVELSIHAARRAHPAQPPS